jgi:hypothetical protein
MVADPLLLLFVAERTVVVQVLLELVILDSEQFKVVSHFELCFSQLGVDLLELCFLLGETGQQMIAFFPILVEPFLQLFGGIGC